MTHFNQSLFLFALYHQIVICRESRAIFAHFFLGVKVCHCGMCKFFRFSLFDKLFFFCFNGNNAFLQVCWNNGKKFSKWSSNGSNCRNLMEKSCKKWKKWKTNWKNLFCQRKISNNFFTVKKSWKVTSKS